MLLLFTRSAVISSVPRNPLLDIIFDCNGVDNDGVANSRKFTTTVSISGTWLNKTIVASPMVITLSQEGTHVPGILITASPLVITLSFKDVDIITVTTGIGWIKWSNIGNLDFTIWKDNIAGGRPLDWKGVVYKVAKLGKKVVVYGSGGVTLLHPSGPLFGIETVLGHGLKSKNAFCGNNAGHYFIDILGQMWKLSDSLEKLDYSEYLSAMSNPVMSYDTANELIYICNGTLGYVYSTKDGSLCSGPVNVSGTGYQDGTLYPVAPAAIVIPNFNFCSDIQDFGNRKNKTIYSLQIGTDLPETLEASIDYRIINNAAFVNIGWFPVTREGIAYTPCFGQEFKFRLRSSIYQYFEIDYIKVDGVIHSHLNFLAREKKETI
jgi:hypothetical protein